MKKNIFYKTTLFVAILLPLVSFAAGDFKWLIKDVIGGYINALVPAIFGIAIVLFLWGGVRFMRADEKERIELRQFFLWGIIALAVMASVWGLVAFVQTTFGLDNTSAPSVPNITSIEFQD
ncbi:MAG: hypothetical protein WCW14_01530 [Candidatus Paceibacterota bacterium]|jgi:hypothetical protein